MLAPAKRYDGYRSYGYLEEGRDYDGFELVPELGRVPPYEGLSLSDEQRQRVERLLTDGIVISLHEHPTVIESRRSEALARFLVRRWTSLSVSAKIF